MDSHSIILTSGSGETEDIGFAAATSLVGLWKRSDPGCPAVFCLYGDLGSGKSTFSRGFARGLGITGRLLSPTFIIVRRYEIPHMQRFLYHMDAYRTQSKQDLLGVGLPEILSDSRSCILIEWADRLGDLLPPDRTDIHFSVTDGQKHSIEITGTSYA